MAEAEELFLPTGYWLGDLLIVQLLGKGGFGSIYLARNRFDGQFYALKEYYPRRIVQRRDDLTIVPRVGEEERFRQGFMGILREAEMLSRFQHPHIVSLVELLYANGTVYLVMRHIQGEILAKRLDRRGRISESEILALLEPLCDALANLHEAGFVHRDLKPANVMIGPGGGGVLLDFGSFANFGWAMETHFTEGYSPFEQYLTRTDLLGPWSDLYALGATLHHAIAGYPPLSARIRAEAISRGEADPLPRLSNTIREGYGSALLEAVDQALAFHPSDRPSDIGAWWSGIARLKGDRSMWGYGAVILSLALSAGLLSQGGQALSKAPAMPAIAAHSETSRKIPVPPAESRRARIERLFREAERDLAENRIFSPKGNNAVEKYQLIMRLNPGDPRAHAGIERSYLCEEERQSKGSKAPCPKAGMVMLYPR